MPNHFADRARSKKAVAMVAAIDRSAINQGIDPHGSAGQVLLAAIGWDEVAWAQICRLANCKAASAVTREMVVSTYRGRANAPIQRRAS